MEHDRSTRTARAVRAILVAVSTVFALAVFATPALAGTDTWSCSSTAGSPCPSPFTHHSKSVRATYTGSGNLPLFAGSVCVESACGVGSYLFYANTGSTGTYNNVLACWDPSCGVNAAYLGRAQVGNQHTSTHTVNGADNF